MEDILADGDYVESAFWFTGGLVGGTLSAVLSDYADRDEASLHDSAGYAAFLTGATDGADEIISFLEGEPASLGAENYPEFWAGAALADQGVRQMADRLYEK